MPVLTDVPHLTTPTEPDPASSTASPDAPIRFDTKIAVVLHEDLAVWQALNVTVFVVSGIAGSDPGLIGEPYLDGDDTAHLAMIRPPVLVFSATSAQLTAIHMRVSGGASPWPSTRATCSARATTATTGPPSGACDAATCISWESPSGAHATWWTRR